MFELKALTSHAKILYQQKSQIRDGVGEDNPRILEGCFGVRLDH
jgi:hypothetical protein